MRVIQYALAALSTLALTATASPLVVEKRCEALDCAVALGPSVINCAKAAVGSFTDIILDGTCVIGILGDITSPPDTCAECVKEIENQTFNIPITAFDPKVLIGEAFDKLMSILPADGQALLQMLKDVLEGHLSFKDMMKALMSGQLDKLKDLFHLDDIFRRSELEA
ncbi:hypothetical protein DL96DRAFT_1626392 [Flagelloscypha sp. PMI_526]|nr:hypothetical protein DL96DRAFT_1626392 [Flagelloscypha sp. PMI_526]